jgi:serine/threonine protein kinase
VGTKKYRPPEMRDGRPATSAVDVFCFGLMVEKLLRQVRAITFAWLCHGTHHG